MLSGKKMEEGGVRGRKEGMGGREGGREREWESDVNRARSINQRLLFCQKKQSVHVQE